MAHAEIARRINHRTSTPEKAIFLGGITADASKEISKTFRGGRFPEVYVPRLYCLVGLAMHKAATYATEDREKVLVCKNWVPRKVNDTLVENAEHSDDKIELIENFNGEGRLPQVYHRKGLTNPAYACPRRTLRCVAATKPGPHCNMLGRRSS